MADATVPRRVLTELVQRALAEDLGPGDVTSEATVPAEARALGVITQKDGGVIYGVDAAALAFTLLDPDAVVEAVAVEGVWRESGAEVLRVSGSARALLAGERTALNLLAHLSGIATLTARCVRELEGTRTQILDTRKTAPGLRALEKGAVRAGGGVNHRLGLYDAILLKENHIALAGGIGPAVAAARDYAPNLLLEVEVRSEDEIEAALAAGAPRLLLDNMTAAQLRAAVEQVGSRAELEASGGVNLENLKAVAASGVDFISMGALTHSAPALDLSMIIEPFAGESS